MRGIQSIRRMLVTWDNRSSQNKPVPQQLCALQPPHIHGIVWNRIGTSAVGLAK